MGWVKIEVRSETSDPSQAYGIYQGLAIDNSLFPGFWNLPSYSPGGGTIGIGNWNFFYRTFRDLTPGVHFVEFATSSSAWGAKIYINGQLVADGPAWVGSNTYGQPLRAYFQVADQQGCAGSGPSGTVVNIMINGYGNNPFKINVSQYFSIDSQQTITVGNTTASQFIYQTSAYLLPGSHYIEYTTTYNWSGEIYVNGQLVAQGPATPSQPLVANFTVSQGGSGTG